MLGKEKAHVAILVRRHNFLVKQLADEKWTSEKLKKRVEREVECLKWTISQLVILLKVKVGAMISEEDETKMLLKMGIRDGEWE